MDAAGSLVGLMKPFSLIIKPSVNCDGKVTDIIAYVVQDISYNQPVGRLIHDEWDMVLPMLTVLHGAYTHLPHYLEARVGSARYREVDNTLFINVLVEPHERERRMLVFRWLRRDAFQMLLRHGNGERWDIVKMYENMLKGPPRLGEMFGALLPECSF